MTTIASDGVTVVADGRGVSGTTIVSEGREKLRRIGRKIYAFSGAYGLMDPVIYWERDGQEAAPALGEQEWELAVFEIGRVTYYCSAVPFPVLDVGGHDGLDLRVGPRPRHRGAHLLVLEEATERGAVVGRDRPTDEPVGAGRAARAHGASAAGGVEAWLIVEMASERWRA